MSTNDQHQFKDRYMLRLPDGMRDRIKTAADANKRSMNAEIVATLEEKYPPPRDEALISLLMAKQSDLFERILEEKNEAQKAAMVAEFLSIRDKMEELIELKTFKTIMDMKEAGML